ncbi:hypothetical protein PLICRDRAFT_180482 [Plicaturopsis crispa FD-325 SS-3]|uniref:Uncharacterized protein n=1 Tax=Plicaturopsis crispa FD-325 SS-3 TaxID=944288 RepID=A0A0C9T2A6_PLICR|nr:hypothetical protein PLICRDRAFT_180482 [Plicaturopsis crispa FD-325 SS-3]
MLFDVWRNIYYAPPASPAVNSSCTITILRVGCCIVLYKVLYHTRLAVLARNTHLSFAAHTSDGDIKLVLQRAPDLLPYLPRLTHLATALPQTLGSWYDRLELFCTNVHRAELRALLLERYVTAYSNYTDADVAFLDSLREHWPSVGDVTGGCSDGRPLPGQGQLVLRDGVVNRLSWVILHTVAAQAMYLLARSYGRIL